MDQFSSSSEPQGSPVVEFFRVRQTAWLQFVKENQISFVMFVVFTFLAIRQFRSKMNEAQKAGANRTWCDAPGFPEIEQLEDFKWQDEAPIKLRTFKPKFYLTMGELITAKYTPVLCESKLMFAVLTRFL